MRLPPPHYLNAIKQIANDGEISWFLCVDEWKNTGSNFSFSLVRPHQYQSVTKKPFSLDWFSNVGKVLTCIHRANRTTKAKTIGLNFCAPYQNAFIKPWGIAVSCVSLFRFVCANEPANAILFKSLMLSYQWARIEVEKPFVGNSHPLIAMFQLNNKAFCRCYRFSWFVSQCGACVKKPKHVVVP